MQMSSSRKSVKSSLIINRADSPTMQDETVMYWDDNFEGQTYDDSTTALIHQEIKDTYKQQKKVNKAIQQAMLNGNTEKIKLIKNKVNDTHQDFQKSGQEKIKEHMKASQVVDIKEMDEIEQKLVQYSKQFFKAPQKDKEEVKKSEASCWASIFCCCRNDKKDAKQISSLQSPLLQTMS